MGWRPETIREVARRHIGNGESFFNCLKDFYASIYLKPLDSREKYFIDEPEITENPKYNAYLAAVAEYFALRHKFKIPQWCLDRNTRFLKIPWFPCGSEYLKAILLVESPISFRRRFIFVDSDPCYRPSRDVLEPESSPAFNKEK